MITFGTSTLICIARKTFRTINIAFFLSLNVISMILVAPSVPEPIEGVLVQILDQLVIISSAMLINYRLSSKDYQKLSPIKYLNKTKVKLYNR